MSEFERGSWVTIAVVMAAITLVLAITGSDDWVDGVTITLLTAYIASIGKRVQRR